MTRSIQLCLIILVASVTLLAVATPPSTHSTTKAALLVEVNPDALATTSTFYTVRRDVRRCASPLCGGYFIKRVNQSITRCADGRNQPSCYVANIEWEGQPEVEPQKALLRGTLVSRGDRRGTYGVLRISESWQAVSDNSASGDFFRVRDRGLRCIAAPCETHHEARLNATVSREIAGVDLNSVGANESTMSETYQALTGADGILVAGTHTPVTGPAGRSVSLKATQFYLRAKSTVSMKPCMKTGCSGEICADEEKMSTCVYRSEYACYKKARCERQQNGNCGFTQTAELQSCLRRR
jgi:hypothetical protein